MKRFGFGFLWFLAIWIGTLMIGGGISGAIAGGKVGANSSPTTDLYKDAHEAGQRAGAEFGRKYGLLVLLGSFIIAAGGTISGTLPGTEKRQPTLPDKAIPDNKQSQAIRPNSETDATLLAQDNNCELVMRNIKTHPSAPGGRCKLKVASLPFSGEMDFLFDTPLDEIVKHLEVLHSTLSGDVRISAQHEEAYILLKADRGGAIVVSGLLMNNLPLVQRLEFSFNTDHTALPKFIADLKRASEFKA